MTAGATRQQYHHGNLAAALVAAGLELAAEGGPDAVVLREVARRVGVSPTAAYRHFANQADLNNAIKLAAIDRLADHMRSALRRDDAAGRVAATDLIPLPGITPDSAQEKALRRIEMLGRAYFDFAVSEPGLFQSLAIGLPLPSELDVSMLGEWCADGSPGGDGALGLVSEALDDVVTAGLLDPQDRTVLLDIALWATVHGLAVLCLDGPLGDLPAEVQQALLNTQLTAIIYGIIRPTDGRLPRASQ